MSDARLNTNSADIGAVLLAAECVVFVAVELDDVYRHFGKGCGGCLRFVDERATMLTNGGSAAVIFGAGNIDGPAAALERPARQHLHLPLRQPMRLRVW